MQDDPVDDRILQLTQAHGGWLPGEHWSARQFDHILLKSTHRRVQKNPVEKDAAFREEPGNLYESPVDRAASYRAVARRHWVAHRKAYRLRGGLGGQIRRETLTRTLDYRA